MDKPRVIILRSNQILPDSRVEKESACLAEAGYDVRIVCWDRRSNHKTTNEINEIFGCKIPITRIGYKASFGAGMKSIKPFTLFQLSLAKWLITHRNEYDIIHACDFDTAFTASTVNRFLKKKFVFDIFDFMCGDPKTFKQRTIKNAQFQIINNSTATIICSEQRKKQIQGSNPKKLAVIHNSPPKVDPKKKPFIDNGKVKVCYVGILQDYRLLTEIPDYFKENDNVELHIGGFGKYENMYQELSEQYDNIKFYGCLQYDQTLELENSCDIMLAIYDPTIENHIFAAPNKFYESLMLGKPVVMVKGTGMSDVVSNNNIGVLIDYSLDGFSKGISSLIENRDKWEEINIKMRNIYNEYSWENMKNRLLSLYESI